MNVSAGMKKFADSGLGYRHLALAYKRDGADGLRSLLGEKSGRKVRVTRSAKVLDAICQHFLNSERASPLGEVNVEAQ